MQKCQLGCTFFCTCW